MPWSIKQSILPVKLIFIILLFQYKRRQDKWSSEKKPIMYTIYDDKVEMWWTSLANVTLFNTYLLASHIAVPLLAVDNDDTHDLVKMFFETSRFDVIGFKNEDHIIGYLHHDYYDYFSNSISENIINFEPRDITAANTPLIEALKLMNGQNRLFLMNQSTIDLLITKADLQKSPIRMLFFGLVTLLESELA